MSEPNLKTMSSSELMQHLDRQRIENDTPMNATRERLAENAALYDGDKGMHVQVDKNPISGQVTINAIPIAKVYPDPTMISKPGVVVAEDIVLQDPHLNALPQKAKDFIVKADSYGNISQKISILGSSSFSKVLIILASDEMRTALTLPEPPPVVDIDTQGVVDFASTIGIDKYYLDTLFGKYLKSFLR